MTRPRANSASASLNGLISVHDVMPETRHRIERILQRLEAVPPSAVALLVVPGRAWTAGDLNWLHTLAAKGYTMVGHGWCHQCDQPRTLKHRLHSWLISNRAAEHLSLSDSGITELLQDCHNWLEDLGLGPADTYIPPAWALGSISRESLKSSPFRYVETLRGLLDADNGRCYALPVVGFEVDRFWRAIAMRLINRFNVWLALRRQCPLRIAIHPHDWQYPLADQLDSIVDRVEYFYSYRAWPADAGCQP